MFKKWIHFKEIYPPKSEYSNETYFSDFNPYLDEPLNMEEVEKVLTNLRTKKAPGTDDLPYEFYKYAPTEWKREFLSFLNLMFDKEQIPPEAWKILLTLLFKKGDLESVSRAINTYSPY